MVSRVQYPDERSVACTSQNRFETCIPEYLPSKKCQKCRNLKKFSNITCIKTQVLKHFSREMVRARNSFFTLSAPIRVSGGETVAVVSTIRSFRVLSWYHLPYLCSVFVFLLSHEHVVWVCRSFVYEEACDIVSCRRARQTQKMTLRAEVLRKTMRTCVSSFQNLEHRHIFSEVFARRPLFCCGSPKPHQSKIYKNVDSSKFSKKIFPAPAASRASEESGGWSSFGNRYLGRLLQSIEQALLTRTQAIISFLRQFRRALLNVGATS